MTRQIEDVTKKRRLEEQTLVPDEEGPLAVVDVRGDELLSRGELWRWAMARRAGREICWFIRGDGKAGGPEAVKKQKACRLG